MNRIWVVCIALILCCFACGIGSDGGVKVTENGNSIIIEVNDNRFEGTVIAQYEEELRIYGATPQNQKGWNPMVGTHMIKALPVNEVNADASCEEADATRAPILNAVASTKEIREKMDALEQMKGFRKATISGKKIAISSFKYKTEDHSNVLQPQGQFDPREALLVTDVRM